jgi:signal transduction histidine kinase
MNHVEPSPRGRSRPRVLFVDDEPHVVSALADSLRQSYEVTTATSGSEGLRVLVDQGPFAVLVSDFCMPGMNGAEFLAQVRYAAPDTVRMLLTGHATVDGAIAAVNEGNVFRFLTKPCPPAVLVRALEDAIEQSRLVTADRLLLEHKLESMSGHLIRAERLASLGTMAGAIGHELNNMLTVLMGTVDFLEEDVEKGELPNRATLDTLRQVQQHLALHAHSLLDFGRPERGHHEERTDLRKAVTDVVAMLRMAGILRSVQVRLDLPEQAVSVPLRKSGVEQVILNLVKNAVEALADQRRANPRVDITLTCDGTSRMAVCTVSDNGSGIAEHKLPLLFEPYFTTKSADRGTGLGLFVVKHVVCDAGGDVAVKSVSGQSTTFTLRVPLAEEERGETNETHALSPDESLSK